MSKFIVPTSPPFSVSGAGGRLGAGAGGVYRKRERRILFKGSPNNASSGQTIIGGQANALIQLVNVVVASARVRVGIIVGAHKGTSGEVIGNKSYIQIWPGVSAIEDRSDNQPQPIDGSPYLFGQPVLGVPSVIQPQSAASGFFTGPDVKSVTDHGATFAGSWPLFYEAQSIANVYRVEVGMGDSSGLTVMPSPVFLDVAWEIIDPRDGEDTQAILAACSVDAPYPTII